MRGRLAVFLIASIFVASACGGASGPAAGSAAPSGAASAKPSGPADKVTLRLDWFASPHQTPFMLAKQKGYYTAANLDVTIFEGKGSLATLQSVAAGSDTFGFVAGSTYALGKAKALPVMMVADYVQTNPAVVMSWCDKPVTKPEDIRGKSIAFTPGATPTVDMLPALLGKYGMSLTDVKQVNMEPAAQIPAFLDGKVDLVTGFAYSSFGSAQLGAAKAGKGKVCALTIPDFGINMLGHGIVVNQSTLQQNPDLVRRFIAASDKGWADAIADPKSAVDATIAQFSTVDRAFLEAGMTVLPKVIHTANTTGKPLGWMAEKDWQDTLDLSAKYLDLKGDMTAKNYFTDDYIPAQ